MSHKLKTALLCFSWQFCASVPEICYTSEVVSGPQLKQFGDFNRKSNGMTTLENALKARAAERWVVCTWQIVWKKFCSHFIESNIVSCAWMHFIIKHNARRRSEWGNRPWWKAHYLSCSFLTVCYLQIKLKKKLAGACCFSQPQFACIKNMS